MLPRELHADLVSTGFAAPVVVVPVTFTESGDADVVVTLFPAARKMKLIAASYVQSIDAQAATTYVATIKNGSVVMSEGLDILALADDVSAQFVIKRTKDADLAKGDIISIDFNETGGTVTSPEVVWLLLEFQLLA